MSSFRLKCWQYWVYDNPEEDYREIYQVVPKSYYNPLIDIYQDIYTVSLKSGGFVARTIWASNYLKGNEKKENSPCWAHCHGALDIFRKSAIVIDEKRRPILKKDIPLQLLKWA